MIHASLYGDDNAFAFPIPFPSFLPRRFMEFGALAASRGIGVAVSCEVRVRKKIRSRASPRLVIAASVTAQLRVNCYLLSVSSLLSFGKIFRRTCCEVMDERQWFTYSHRDLQGDRQGFGQFGLGRKIQKFFMAAKKVDALEEHFEGEMSQIKATVEDRISSIENKVFDLHVMIKKILENKIAASKAKEPVGKTTSSVYRRRDDEVETWRNKRKDTKGGTCMGCKAQGVLMERGVQPTVSIRSPRDAKEANAGNREREAKGSLLEN
ncbi:hypothetical protein M5K25_025478 [Dendrobium thyrsiflorum]|uniref:Uncharacterized protein n=1 Tax=Dendrobium thyrsiflorum TaxID=117978 RepID=A0ABD0U9I7_DENTH